MNDRDRALRAAAELAYAYLQDLPEHHVGATSDAAAIAAAGRIAERLAADPRVEILNDVVLNQVLVAFHPVGERDPAEGDALTRTVVTRVHEGGTAWMGSTVWHGHTAMRISVSNWSTTEADADRTADAVLAAIGPNAA